MRWARTANGVLRSAWKTVTASCNFFSMASSLSGWKTLMISPVAGLTVAIGMIGGYSWLVWSASSSLIPESQLGFHSLTGHTTIPTPRAVVADSEILRETLAVSDRDL